MAENNQTVQKVNVIRINQEGPVEQSDLTKYVDLKVKIPYGVGRKNQNEEFTSLHLGDAYTMNGNEIGERLLSTSYVDISLTTGDRATITRELLGVTNIDISFDSNLYPIVTMNFVDVRGMALFGPTQYAFNSIDKKDPNAAEILQQTSQTFFKALFAYPYPIFTLTVKGYYGPATKFDLQVQDFKSSFDSNNGDFKITVVFIGHMYGCLADIPMSHVLMAPYFDSKDSRPSTIWETKNFTFGSGEKIPTIVEFLKRADELYHLNKEKNITLDIDSSKEYKKLNHEIKCLEEVKSALKKHDEAVIAATRASYDGEDENPNGLIIDRGASKHDIKKIDDIPDSGEVYLKDISKTTEPYNIFKNTISQAIGEIPGSEFTDEIFKINERNGKIQQWIVNLGRGYVKVTKTEGGETINKERKLKNGWNFSENKVRELEFKSLIKNGENIEDYERKISESNKDFLGSISLNPTAVYHIILFDNITRKIEASLINKREKIKNLSGDVENEIKQICKEYLGFMPSAKNIYNMLFAHLDVLNESVSSCVSDIERELEKNKRIHGGIFNGGLEYDYPTEDNTQVPAFPYVAKKHTKGNDGDNTNDNNTSNDDYVPIFPSLYNKAVKNEGLTLSEVKYVENIYDRISEMGSNIKGILDNIENVDKDVTSGDYGSITPNLPSDLYFNKNPYECVKNNGHNMLLLLTLRMRANKLCGTMDDSTFLNSELKNILSTTHNMNVLDVILNSDLFKTMEENYGGDIKQVNAIDNFVLTNQYKNSEIKPPKNNEYITESILWVDNISEIDRLIKIKKILNNKGDNDTLCNQLKNKWFQIYNKTKPGDNGVEADNTKSIIPFFVIGDDVLFENNKTRLNAVELGAFETELEELFNAHKGLMCHRDGKGNINVLNSIGRLGAQHSQRLELFKCDNKTNKCDGLKIIGDNNTAKENKNLLLGILYLTSFLWKGGVRNPFPNIFSHFPLVDTEEGPTTFELSGKKIFKTTIYNLLLYGALCKGEELCKIANEEALFNEQDSHSTSSERNATLCGIIGYMKGSAGQFQSNLGETRFRGLRVKDIEHAFNVWATNTGDTIQVFGKEVYTLNHFYNLTEEGVISISKNYNIYHKSRALNQEVNICIINKNYSDDEGEKYLIYQEKDLSFNDYKGLNNLKNGFFKESNINYDTKDKTNEEKKKIANDAKRNIYYSLKNIYDRWMCDNNERFNIEKEGSIYKNLHFYNYHSRDIGDKFMIDIDSFNHLIEQALSPGNSMTVIEFMAALAERNNCLFLSLPMNMLDGKNLKKAFEPTPWSVFQGEAKNGHTFIFYLPGENSHHLNIENGAFTDDALKENDNAPITAFGIEYGKQNQNHFKNVSVDMSTSIMTEEEIANTLDIANRGKTGAPLSIHKAKSLFPAYQGRSFTCKVDMLGDMSITPMMHFELSNIPMFRGIYKILNVTHRITPEDFTTTFEGVRMSKFTTPINEKPIDITFMLDKIKNENTNTAGEEIKEGWSEELYKGAYNAAKEIWREIDGIRSSDYRQTLLNCLEKKQEISSYSMCTIEQSENLKNKGGCSVSILELLLLLGLICEKLKLGLDLAIVSGSRKELTEQSWVKLNTQHIGGRAVDIQGFKGGKKDKTLTAKLFIVLKAINDSVENPHVGKAIDQLIWETHEGDGDVCPYPNTIHFSCKDPGDIDKTDNSKNRGEIFQSHVTTRIVKGVTVYDTKTVNTKNGNTDKKSYLFTKYSNFTPESLGIKA